jgi:hypothetical protein
MKLYKVLDENGCAAHGGQGQWNLPTDKPGEWMPKIKGKLVPCENGYHACRREDLIMWLGPRIFELESRGEMVVSGNKVVVRGARLTRELTTWNERTARLFSCDCAELALTLVERPDPRSVDAIRVARLYADGRATDDELSAAEMCAWSASANAARRRANAPYAARGAAYAAAYATAYAARSAESAAHAAHAAWIAAHAANAAYAHMTDILFGYLEETP